MTPDGAAFKDDNPHLKVGSLFDQDVFLRGKEPKKIAAANLIAAITQKVGAGTSGDEVQFELGVVMSPVGSGWVRIAPCHAIEFRRKVKTLQHDDKK